MPTTGDPEGRPPFFTDEDIERLIAFSATLKRIHVRLLTEGYVIKDGEFINPPSTTEIEYDVIIKA